MVLSPIDSDLSTPRIANLGLLIVFGVLSVLPRPAVADDGTEVTPEIGTVEEVTDPFNGAFVEGSLRGGPTLPADTGGPGWLGEVGYRSSAPMYTGDHRLAYQYGRWGTDDATLQLHGLHATIGLHPLFLALLGQGLVSHLLASFHIELGVGPQFAHLSVDDGSETSSQFGVAGSLGAGFDVPLTDPNQGQSIWINAVYRHQWSSIDFAVDDRRFNVTHHLFSLGLAWRSNGTIW